MYVTIEFGTFTCSSFLECTVPGPLLPGETNCQVTVATEDNEIDCKPTTPHDLPLEIVLDFGDGSPPIKRNPDDLRNSWSHAYSFAGVFTVSVRSKSSHSIVLVLYLANNKLILHRHTYH